MNSQQTVVPKPRPAELSRDRLLRLFGACADTRLIALIAPSGYGKSTLLAQWTRRCERHCAWLPLRPDDADPRTFAASLLRALSTYLPNPARPLSDPFLELGSRLDQAELNLDLVLDRAEYLSPESSACLERLLENLGEGHRVLLAGYSLEHIALPRLLAEGTARVIGPAQLAFTSCETHAYLEARGYEGDPVALHTALEGWPAGVALAASGAAPVVTLTDLVRLAFRELSPELRATLCEASVLPLWSEAAARELGCALPRGWLAQVRRAGIPLTPLSDGSFQPHQLVVQTLQLELAERPERASELHSRAARLLEAQGSALSALEHYLRARNWPEALRLACALAEDFEARSEYRLMRQVLESVPPEQLTPTARLLQAHALVQTGGTPRTVALLDPLPASARSDARLWLVQCILAARRGQSAALLELAQQGLALPGSPPHIVSALQLYQASALVDCGHEEQGAALARELIGYAAGGLTAQLAGLTLLQGLHARRGEWTEHDHLLERRLELSEQAGLRHAWVHARIDRIARCRVLGRLDEAARLWEAARQAVEQTGGASEVFLHELRGELQLAQHRPQEALEAFQHASELCQHFGHHRILGRVLLGRAETQLRLGNLEAAQESLLLAQATPAAGARWFQHALNFVSGLLALEADRAERAAEHLRQVGHASSDPTHRPRAQALLAELDARAGHLERASLQGIFAELDRLGSDFALTLDRPQLSRLLQLCAQRDWYVARLSGIGPHTALRAPLLHLRTLGSLEVSIDGVPVRLPLAKGGELLAWLALHGQASREQLVNALWDGCNATRHHEYCRVAIRRLRVALSAAGQLDFNPLPFDGHSYRIAPQFRVTLDLEALRAAEQTPQQPEALEAALKAYRGPFLPEAETEWAEVLRSQLEASALRLALHLGDSLLPSDPRRAAAAFERALALDPLTAEAYLGLCRAHLQSGNRLAARAVHDEYRRHLGWDDPRGDLERALLELLRS